mgnify:CR=1 FL=1
MACLKFEVEIDEKAFEDAKAQEPWYADMSEADILEDLIETMLSEGLCLPDSYDVRVKYLGTST